MAIRDRIRDIGIELAASMGLLEALAESDLTAEQRAVLRLAETNLKTAMDGILQELEAAAYVCSPVLPSAN